MTAASGGGSRLSAGVALLLVWLLAITAPAEDGADSRRVLKNRLLEMITKVGELQEQGRLPDARAAAEEAVALSERELGPDDPQTATCLGNLAGVLQAMGDLKAARARYERALAIDEKALGPEDPVTANSMNNLGVFLSQSRKPEEGRPLLERTVAILEKAVGRDHPSLAMYLHNLASVVVEMGDGRAGRQLHERALAICEKSPGQNDPLRSAILSDLGELLRARGDLLAARPLLERALAISREAKGPYHPDTATAMCCLAALLYELGDLESARRLCERSLAIRELAVGPGHPVVVESLNVLGALLLELGETESARWRFERALTISEREKGPDHPETAACRNNLAFAFERLGDRATARTLFEWALAIHEKVHGPDHPGTADAQNNLAGLLQELGELPAARALYEHALAIRERQFGPDHPKTAVIVGNLAALLKAMGDLPAARALVERSWGIGRHEMHTLLADLSSRERVAMLFARAGLLRNYIAAFAAEPRKTFAACLGWKGAALRAGAATLRLPPDASPELLKAFAELVGLRARLARLVFAPPSPDEGARTVAEQCADLERDIGRKEREVAAQVPDFVTRALLDVSPEDVLAALPPGAVLLDILENSGELHAWVVRAGADIKYFPLGRAADLAATVGSFRSSLQEVPSDRAQWRTAGRALRAKLAAPLDAALAGGGPLYLAPDGLLATVPLGLLPAGAADAPEFLFEKTQIIQVTGGAALVLASQTRSAARGRGLLAVGGIDYDKAEGAAAAGRWPIRHVPALQATEAEARATAARFHARFPDAPTSVLTGKAATEGACKRQLPSVRFWHAATHGFFEPPPPTRRTSEVRAPGVPERVARPGGWDPLLHSGVVLAGVNANDGGDGEDGLLTAEELQGVDLTGVELVVLSACDTGRGQTTEGEGVLGLPRALAQAGAHGCLLSLWPVPDETTRELMDAFYDGLWGDLPLPAAEALRRAQQRMLAKDRKDGAFRPYLWGAWVLIE